MHITLGFPGGSNSKESACNAGEPSLIPGSGRCPWEGNGNPLQYSCLENSMDRGAWRATVHGVSEWDNLATNSHFSYNFVCSYPPSETDILDFIRWIFCIFSLCGVSDQMCVLSRFSKESACSVGDPGSIPVSGRSPGEGNGKPLQYSCLKNPLDEEPSRIQPMGSQKVGHDWWTSLSLSASSEVLFAAQNNFKAEHGAGSFIVQLFSDIIFFCKSKCPIFLSSPHQL